MLSPYLLDVDVEFMMLDKKVERPFGLRDKVGYLFGDFGNDFTFVLSSSFLLKFYTDVMGVSAAAVGIIIMASRFIDGFTDVTMGRIADKARVTKNGKFKPWILRMCIPVSLASFLIYQSSLSSAPELFKIIYLAFTYVLWGSVFYTAINIPYGSMASLISPDPNDRQSLSTFRSIGAVLAGAVIGSLVPLIAYDEVPNVGAVMNGPRFTLVSLISSILAIISYLACYMLVKERVVPEMTVKAKDDNVFRMLRRAAKNRALISIIAASVVMLLAQLTMQTMTNYIFPNYYGNAGAQTIATLVMVGATLLSGVFAKPLARRFGKAEVAAVSAFFSGIVSACLFLFRPESVWLYIAFQAFQWLGLGMFTMVSWALISDVIDDAEARSGIREDGSVYALYSFARKLGQAAAAGASGFMLSYIGYSSTTAFDPEVLDGIYAISTLVPAIGFILLALVLFFWYPLKKKKVEYNLALLRKRREEGD